MALSFTHRVLKRCFDLIVALTGLVVLMPFSALIMMAIFVTTKGPVFFQQKRVGRRGLCFNVIKFRTMMAATEHEGTITTANDRRITSVGRVLRRYKFDEYPQLWNVLTGKMSLVGPRPDVPGYADRLQGADRVVLELLPGITGPASLMFRDEEMLLAMARDPRSFNDKVVFPEKVRINREYIENGSFWLDLGYIVATVMPCATQRMGLDRRLGLDYEAFRQRMEQNVKLY